MKIFNLPFSGTWPVVLDVTAMARDSIMMALFDSKITTCLSQNSLPNGIKATKIMAPSGLFNVTLYHVGGYCHDDFIHNAFYVSLGSIGQDGHIRMAACALISTQDNTCTYSCNQDIYGKPSLWLLISSWFWYNPKSSLCEIDLST